MAYKKKVRRFDVPQISGNNKALRPELVGGVQLNAFSDQECTVSYGKGKRPTQIKLAMSPGSFSNQLTLAKQPIQ